MGWLTRTGGVLFAPRKTFHRILQGQEGHFADILLLMFFAMLGTLPLHVGAIVAGGMQGGSGSLGKLFYLYVHFSALPLVICVSLAILMVGMERFRGHRIQLEGLMVASAYLWVPVGAMGLLGGMLQAFGLEFWFLPHLPLDLFFKLDPPWWMFPLRLLFSYGWSLALIPILIREARRDSPADLPVISRQPALALAALLVASYVAGGIHVARKYEDIRPRQIGDPAPPFELPRSDGKGKLSLKTLAGKPVVIDFWATWCSNCVAGMPKLIAFSKTHPEIPVLAIHVGGDIPEVSAFVADRKWSGVTFLVDVTGQTAQAYQADTFPRYLILGRDGRIRATRIGIPPPGWLEGAIQ